MKKPHDFGLPRYLHWRETTICIRFLRQPYAVADTRLLRSWLKSHLHEGISLCGAHHTKHNFYLCHLISCAWMLVFLKHVLLLLLPGKAKLRKTTHIIPYKFMECDCLQRFGDFPVLNGANALSL